MVPEHHGWHLGIAWSPEGRYLAVGAAGYGDTRGVWALAGAEQVGPRNLRRDSVAVDPDQGRTLLAVDVRV